MLRNTLVPRDLFETSPMDIFRAFEREMDRWFGDMLPSRRRESNLTSFDFTPACDVEETDTHWVLRFDLPGMSKDDIEVRIDDNVLTVSGERKKETERKESGRVYYERSYGGFSRSFTLPEAVDPSSVEASYENGVLTVCVPRSSSKTSGKVKIVEGKGGILKRLLSAAGKKEEEQDKKESGKHSKAA